MIGINDIRKVSIKQHCNLVLYNYLYNNIKYSQICFQGKDHQAFGNNIRRIANLLRHTTTKAIWLTLPTPQLWENEPAKIKILNKYNRKILNLPIHRKLRYKSTSNQLFIYIKVYITINKNITFYIKKKHYFQFHIFKSLIFGKYFQKIIQ